MNIKLNVDNVRFYLNRSTVIAVLIAVAFPITALAGVGKVQFVIGNVTVVGTDGVARVLTKGADINTGDTIQTSDGRAQVRFIDGGYMSFQPDTEFKVEEYNFSGQADGTEKGIFRLVKGGLRAITGLIGKANKQAWRMNTPVATIGIRGTETLDEFKDGVLRVTVGDGAAYLENTFGDLILYQGQTGMVDGNSAPQYSAEEVKISAAGPRRGHTEKNEHQRNAQNDNDDIGDSDKKFSVADFREKDGVHQEVKDARDNKIDKIFLGGPIASLPQLSFLKAKAEYTATTSISFFSPGTSTALLYSNLKIDFEDYEAQFSIKSGKFAGGALDNKRISADTFATLNSATGAIIFPDATVNITGGGVGTLTGTSAQLNPANISQAAMTYTIGVPGGSETIGQVTPQVLTRVVEH